MPLSLLLVACPGSQVPSITEAVLRAFQTLVGVCGRVELDSIMLSFLTSLVRTAQPVDMSPASSPPMPVEERPLAPKVTFLREFAMVAALGHTNRFLNKGFCSVLGCKFCISARVCQHHKRLAVMVLGYSMVYLMEFTILYAVDMKVWPIKQVLWPYLCLILATGTAVTACCTYDGYSVESSMTVLAWTVASHLVYLSCCTRIEGMIFWVLTVYQRVWQVS